VTLFRRSNGGAILWFGFHEIRKGEYFTEQSEIRPPRFWLGEEALKYDSAGWAGQDANSNILMRNPAVENELLTAKIEDFLLRPERARGRIDCGKSKAQNTKVRNIADSSKRSLVETPTHIAGSFRDNRLHDRRSGRPCAAARCEAHGKK
jgi:hypothetical protein